MKNQMALQMAYDWCTVAWAAETIGVSQRTIRRWINDKTVPGHRVRCGSRESGRGNVVLSVAEVERFAAAYKLVGQRA